MRLFRHIVLANLLAAILLAGVVIALRPRDAQGGVVPRGNAMGIGHSWVITSPTTKALHDPCIVRRAPDLGEISIRGRSINCAAPVPSPTARLPRGMRPEEL